MYLTVIHAVTYLRYHKKILPMHTFKILETNDTHKLNNDITYRQNNIQLWNRFQTVKTIFESEYIERDYNYKRDFKYNKYYNTIKSYLESQGYSLHFNHYPNYIPIDDYTMIQTIDINLDEDYDLLVKHMKLYEFKIV